MAAVSAPQTEGLFFARWFGDSSQHGLALGATPGTLGLETLPWCLDMASLVALGSQSLRR